MTSRIDEIRAQFEQIQSPVAPSNGPPLGRRAMGTDADILLLRDEARASAGMGDGPPGRLTVGRRAVGSIVEGMYDVIALLYPSWLLLAYTHGGPSLRGQDALLIV
eukprot:TRINITY_DN30867_c0_g1_i1.p1 TRINITY_DN30867_c0_g1~~TRINITY_DN30867_c0_g1_i1.p1  ORF type:complete len:106 (-),score=8.53 TRINITY_DN30867_c0_g1_i1:118-435(-)